MKKFKSHYPDHLAFVLGFYWLVSGLRQRV